MTKRKIAMQWWNNLPTKDKEMITQREFEDRTHKSLTGREIEMLYNDEVRIEKKFIDMPFGESKGKIGTQRSPFGIGS